MNEELKDRLVSYLDKLENVVEKTGDFASEQIPDVAQQYINWIIAENTIYAVMWLTMSIGTAYFARFFYKKLNEHGKVDASYQGSEYIPVVLSSIFIFALCLPCFINYSLHATKAIVAPKVVIVEKLAELAKDVRR